MTMPENFPRTKAFDLSDDPRPLDFQASSGEGSLEIVPILMEVPQGDRDGKVFTYCNGKKHWKVQANGESDSVVNGSIGPCTCDLDNRVSVFDIFK